MILKSQNLRSLEGIDHFFSMKEAGIEDIARLTGMKSSNFISVRQVHGEKVHIIEQASVCSDHSKIRADALITDMAGRGIFIRTADCCPILVASKRKPLVGAVHAGWKGSLSMILVRTIEKINERFQIKPSELKITIGPSIGSCCYDVRDDRRKDFTDKFSFAADHFSEFSNKTFFDLKGFNAKLAVNIGVDPKDVEIMDLCTNCSEDMFHSYRRDGSGCGRQLSGIFIRPNQG